MKGKIVLFCMALSLSLFIGGGYSAEYDGVIWPDNHAEQVKKFGYSPSSVSAAMIKHNSQCRNKRVKGVDTKGKNKMCIEFKCGIVTWFANINSDDDTVKIEQMNRCRGWL